MTGEAGGRAPVPLGPGGVPLLEYPQDYVFKVIGLAAEDFGDHVRGLVARLGLHAPEGGSTTRASSGGKYHSVSIAVRLASEDDRRAVYEALRVDARVVYYL